MEMDDARRLTGVLASGTLLPAMLLSAKLASTAGGVEAAPLSTCPRSVQLTLAALAAMLSKNGNKRR
jgi:hypothetical protein